MGAASGIKNFSARKRIVPLWLKLAYSAFVAVLVPIYWVHHGPGNFLWFSDIALFGVLIALWLEKPLLPSMMAVAVLIPEIAWNIGYFGRLITGQKILGLTDYMFDSELPLYLRALSLFHVILPPILLWLLYRLGYDRRAFRFQTVLAWIVLPLTYLLTDPDKNINWAFGFGNEPQDNVHPLVHLGLMMIFFPAIFYWPTHLILKKLFRKPEEIAK